MSVSQPVSQTIYFCKTHRKEHAPPVCKKCLREEYLRTQTIRTGGRDAKIARRRERRKLSLIREQTRLDDAISRGNFTDAATICLQQSTPCTPLRRLALDMVDYHPFIVAKFSRGSVTDDSGYGHCTEHIVLVVLFRFGGVLYCATFSESYRGGSCSYCDTVCSLEYEAATERRRYMTDRIQSIKADTICRYDRDVASFSSYAKTLCVLPFDEDEFND